VKRRQNFAGSGAANERLLSGITNKRGIFADAEPLDAGKDCAGYAEPLPPV